MAREGEQAAAEAGTFVFARVAAEALWIVAVAVAAWLLAPAQFAYVAFALMVTLSAVTLGSLGLAESVFYFIGRHPGRAPAIARRTSLLLAASAVPVVLLVAGVLFVGRPAVDLGAAFPWIVLVICLELPTQPAVNLLVALGRARLAAGLYVLFALLRGVAILAPLILDRPVTWVLPALAASSLVRLAAYVVIVRRFFRTEAAADGPPAPGFGSILAFTLPVGLAELCGALNAQIDKYVVSLALTVRDVADYAIGSWELPLVTTIPYAIGTVLQPRYVSLHVAGRHDDLLELWHGAVRKTSLIVVPAAVLLITLADDLIATLFSAKYARAALPFRLFAAILLLRFAAYGAIFRATGHTRPLLGLAGLLVGVNLALSVPLAHLVGFPGPAAATLAANGIVWIVTLVALARILKVPFARVLPWRSYLVTVLLAAATGVVVWLARLSAGLAAATTLALFVPLYLGLYLLAGRVIGLISAGDLAYVGRWLRLRTLKQESPP